MSEKIMSSENESPDELMNFCVKCCQENKWREAAIAGRKFVALSKEQGNNEFAEAFQNGALKKIDYSLRRQMATALILQAQTMLEKEFLLNDTK